MQNNEGWLTHLRSGVASQSRITLANHLHHKEKRRLFKVLAYILRIPICLHLYYISMKEQGVLSKLRFRHLSSRFPSGIFLNMNSNRLRHHIWTLFRMPLPKQLQFVQQSTLPTHFYLSLQTEICRFRFYSVLIAQNAAVFFLQRISTTNS